MSVTRWLTTLSRICRLNVGTAQPNSVLIYDTVYCLQQRFSVVPNQVSPKVPRQFKPPLDANQGAKTLTPANRGKTYLSFCEMPTGLNSKKCPCKASQCR